MSKFFGEFKKFIVRGNVVDMAVGVIVGSSFTAIVNALSNNILKPLINYLLALIFGSGALEDAYTFLGNPVYVDGVIDLTQSIYIDWGAFINAVLNFFLVAFVLFTIVKVVNGLRDGHKKIKAELSDDIPTKEDKREIYGVSSHDGKDKGGTEHCYDTKLESVGALKTKKMRGQKYH